MKTIKFVLYLLFLLYMKPATAQFEITSTWFSSEPFAIIFNENVYLTSNDRDHFLRYDDHPVTISFPIRDGSRLKFHNIHKLRYNVEYRNFLYMVFHKEDPYSFNVLESERYFYRFDGSSFEEIALPGKPVSNPVVFQDRLYILIDTGREVKLFKYDGFILIDIPSSALPHDRYFSLTATDNYIYAAGSGEGLSNIKRFDGTNIFVLPQISAEYISFLQDIYQIPGSDNIYINHQGLHYFDGTSINEVFHRSARLEYMNGSYYFIDDYAVEPLYRLEEGRIERISIPEGATAFEHFDLISVGNKLYIPTRLPDSRGTLFEFDGSTFVRKLDLESYGWMNHSYNRDDKLVISMTYLPPEIENVRTKIYEFSGESLSINDLPDRFWRAQYLASTPEHHLWFASKNDLFEGTQNFIVKEVKKLNPGYSIIPDHVRNFERAGFGINGRYRDWCWSDIFWDWKINPECPFCPEPRFEASMADVEGNIAWNQQFQKPFQAEIQLSDNNLYKFSLSALSGKTTQNFFLFDDDLVPKGISSFKIQMIPGKEYFHLKVDTDYGKKISFMMTLSDDKDETIWQENFTAPFDQEIKARVEKPGTSLYFSASREEFIQQVKGNLKIKPFPNPFHDKIEIEVNSIDKKDFPVDLHITNLNGQIVYQTTIEEPILESINLSNQKGGFYILTLISGSSVFTELIKLE